MNSCGGAQLSGAILIGSTPKLNGKSSAKATKRFFTFATQNGARMPKCSLRPRCTGWCSCLASRNLARRAKAVRILTTCRWAYEVLLNRKSKTAGSPLDNGQTERGQHKRIAQPGNPADSLQLRLILSLADWQIRRLCGSIFCLRCTEGGCRWSRKRSTVRGAARRSQ